MSGSSHVILGLTLFTFLLCSITGCASATSRTSSQGQSWKNYLSSGGLQLKIPADWNAEAQSDGRIVIHGTAGEQATVWPVFIPDSPGKKTMDAPGADAIAHRLALKAWPAGSFSSLPVTGQTIRLRGHDTQSTGMALFSWTTSVNGTAGILNLGAAPDARYAQVQPVFAEIFQSVHIQGAPGSNSSEHATNLQYAQWRDPREGAFTAEVPQQWQTQGGTFRYASVDVRHALQTQSPDNQILLLAGDASLPPFTLPNQMLAMAGMREGGWYDTGYGVKMMIRRYVPGPAFAYDYAQNAGKSCTGLQIAPPRERREIANAVNATYRQFAAMGMMVQLNVGEVTFTCNHNGAPISGYVFAGTQLVQTQSGASVWNVPYLYSYMAPASREAEARAALDHLVGSFRMDPQWEARQQQTTMATSQIVAQAQQQISDGIMKSWEYKNKVDDEISRRRENAILGTVDVVSPSGRQYKVDNSSNYYWIDGNGNILGTQTSTHPDVNFQQMTQLQ